MRRAQRVGERLHRELRRVLPPLQEGGRNTPPRLSPVEVQVELVLVEPLAREVDRGWPTGSERRRALLSGREQGAL